MKIQAKGLLEFEKQYYKNRIDNKPTIEVRIELKTDDDFWEELTENQINYAITSMEILGNLLEVDNGFNKELTSKNFKKVFHYKYGYIERV